MQTLRSVVATNPVRDRPRYRKIGDYGVIGDCRTAALIGPDGAIDWGCFPHFDSPALFCRLLDADRGGYFRVSPAEGCTAAMGYMQATNILENMFDTGEGRLRLVDFMPIRARRQSTPLVEQLASRLPGRTNGLASGLEQQVGNDVAAAHRIDRLAYCLEGHVTVEVLLKPTFDFARRTSAIEQVPLADGGLGVILSAGGRYLVVLVHRPSTGDGSDGSDPPPTIEERDHELRALIPLRAGQRVNVALNYARSPDEAHELLRVLSTHDFERDLDETRSYWRDWAAKMQYDGPYQDAVMRSALALKLCIFEPTGAIVAAPTTSLPEEVGGIRNWDYRYTWLRDSAFTLHALGLLGYHDEARDYFHFIHDLHIQDISNLHVMYGIRGESDDELAEHDLNHLEGYRGSHPVRVGNGAANQHQLDIYGELLDAAYSYETREGFRHGRRRHESDRDIRALAERVAEYVVQHWQEKDHGIWEVRGTPRAFVYSRAMCWVALTRAAQLAQRRGAHERLAHWKATADQIQQDVIAHGYDVQLGSFTQAYGMHNMDAANLRLALVRFLPPEDQRLLSTIDVTGKKLAGAHSLLYRYEPISVQPGQDKARAEHEVDGLPGGEGAFLACTFWYISALCLVGRLDEARAKYEELLGFAGALGLFSEEIDAHTGDLLGNYPQAFTHIGLVNTAASLQRASEGRATVAPEQETKG